MTKSVSAPSPFPGMHPVSVGLLLLVVGVVCVLVPGLVLHRLGIPHGGTIGLAGVATMVSALLLGWRLGLLSAVVLSVGLTVADAAAHLWITATIVMVVVSVLYGLSSLKGWQWGLMMTAIQFTVFTADPPTRDLTLTHPVSLVKVFLVLTATTAFALVSVALVTGGRGSGAEEPTPRDRVVPYAVILGIAAAITTSIVVLGHFKGAAALMMTPIIVLEPRLEHGMFQRVLDRGWGVAAGSLLAMGASVALDDEWAVYVLGAIAASLALFAQAAKWEYRRYVEAITATVVLLSGSRAAILANGRERLLALALGLAISLVLTALALPFLLRAHRSESGEGDVTGGGEGKVAPSAS